jgi:hypothetical protein
MEEEIIFYSIKEAIKTCDYTKREVEYLKTRKK